MPRAGILTSLDGGGLRTNTHELLEFIDVAIVAERLCEQMDLTPEKMLDYLKSRGCRVGGVTQGERGLLWYNETGTVRTLPALPISPSACSIPTVPVMYFTALTCFRISIIRQKLARPFRICARGLDLQIQRLGNEAGLPTLADIENVKQEFQIGRKKEFWD